MRLNPHNYYVIIFEKEEKMNTINNPLKEDLDHILYLTTGLWKELRDKRIFMTGGTGFFGTWIIESFLWANIKFGLNSQMVVLSRNPQKFLEAHPHLSHPSISFQSGSVTNFYFENGHFDFLFHMAATTAEETFNNADMLDKFDTVVNGTRRVLDFANVSGVKKLLFTSSRVVYDSPTSSSYGLVEDGNIPENYPSAPLTTNTSTLTSWGHAKRTAEHLCCLYNERHGLQTKIARCFSFIGPGLPLDIHYAAGNFIRDALAGGPIKVLGGGREIRSYMYMSDLAIWLWTILLKGKAGEAYNVGSDFCLPIKYLASQIASNFTTRPEVSILGDTGAGNLNKVVPSIQKAERDLGLKISVDLRLAVKKTLDYYSKR